ncbi:MAG: TrkH family potassium uptake protein [Bacteroidales bacterium]|nr:TrkH family potassium uptake protein [Bacteroidales bacterium]MCF8336988.1 TrkH family potassium uptake protein [Bacteroidales bacterium]
MQSKINLNIIVKAIGILLTIEGVFVLLSLPFSIYYSNPDFSQIHLFQPGRDFWPMLLSSAIMITVGLIITWFYRRASPALSKREGFIIVTSSWIVISLFGAIPFFLSGDIPSYTDAFFETMSGFTTTGATILNDIEAMPKGLLFWRSMTHWIGGMGIIVLSLAILPFFGIGGMSLFVAEVPGPTPDKLHPRITATAKRLWGIYVLLTFVETLLLMAGGMDLFNGLTHSFGTMATGGFSPKNTSIAEFSPYIQYIIVLFMIFAGTNFSLHYLALNGRIKEVFRNEEYRYFLRILGAFTLLITLFLIFNGFGDWEESFRKGMFQVVSIVTTTGYITSDYLSWPASLWVIIFMLMFIGGSAGSTGGGIKVMRQLLLFKNGFLELKRMIHPNAIIPVRFNQKTVGRNVIYNILSFFVLYMIIFAISIVVMALVMGLDFETAVGSVAATIGNIGPGIGGVGPVENYAAIPVAGKWFLTFLMLIGRLELFTVLILLSPNFWK